MTTGYVIIISAIAVWWWIAVDQVEADLPAQTLFVTSDKPQEELLAALKKTGKTVEYIGIAS